MTHTMKEVVSDRMEKCGGRFYTFRREIRIT